MEKIVVITDHSGVNTRFLECLRILFPDCEIQTHKKEFVDARIVALVPAEDTESESGLAAGLS